MIGERGAVDILGRPLTPKEAREWRLLDRIENAYASRKNSNGKWGEWAEKHKAENDLLIWVTKVANG